MNLEYIETDRIRMEPYIYDGPNCDQHRPRWIVGVEKEGDTDMGDVIKLRAKRYPPGTQIIIKEPLCPKCGELYKDCNVCDFDWKKWTEEQYSYM